MPVTDRSWVSTPVLRWYRACEWYEKRLQQRWIRLEPIADADRDGRLAEWRDVPMVEGGE